MWRHWTIQNRVWVIYGLVLKNPLVGIDGVRGFFLDQKKVYFFLMKNCGALRDKGYLDTLNNSRIFFFLMKNRVALRDNGYLDTLNS